MAKGFDIASTQYDANFTFSKIGRAQRNMVFRYLEPIINANKKLSVLELNCGTGEDAIKIARLGHQVLATDISKGMIEIAKSKHSPENLEFQVLDINALGETAFNKKFDVVFSNFGGLNCLSKDELSAFFSNVSHHLNANGKLVLVIMPKNCLWERFYFSLKGNFKKAKRRNTEDGLLVNVDGVNIKTWYYNPNDVVSLAKQAFLVNQIRPIGLAIPPSYLENSIFAKKWMISIYKRMDSILTNSFCSKYADHFLIELTKVS